jgi:heme A synthase
MEVVEGTLPPLNEKQWNETFYKYKTDAKKQFDTSIQHDLRRF